MIRITLMCMMVVLLCSSCGLNAREEAVRKKEAELSQREQQLTLRERLLALREEEILQIKQKLDSATLKTDSLLAKTDSSIVYNQQLTGVWNVKMTCTETTCPGSAIGDTKTETWEISYQNNVILAKANVGDKLTRVYTGTYNGTNLVLSEDVANTPLEPATKMTIQLTMKDNNTMEGRREIVRENDCSIVYDLQLNKQSSSTK